MPAADERESAAQRCAGSPERVVGLGEIWRSRGENMDTKDRGGHNLFSLCCFFLLLLVFFKITINNLTRVLLKKQHLLRRVALRTGPFGIRPVQMVTRTELSSTRVCFSHSKHAVKPCEH